ncbi:MAG: phosphotransferase family protein, partial [Candidatus Eremiobacteraeota bacterium]|nr:phosphotransferase family protein [Candidatus Eremiobacteraeota bacterium]
MRERLPDATGPFALAQFGGGHANLTYLVAFGDREYVLRRPPLGPVAASAHDMKREFAVLSNLYRAFPLAPRSYLLCTDVEIVGAEFLIEERKAGIAIRRDLPACFQNDPALARRIGEMLVDTLAALHSVDPASVGLSDLGRPQGYVVRQMLGWSQRWEKARTAGSVAAETLLEWLRERAPESPVVALVHNDYKLDNML